MTVKFTHLASSPAPVKFAAAIFDFDGTLVDTMPLHFSAYRRVFAEMDLELTAADFFDNIGGTARESIPKFLRGRPSRYSVAEIHSKKKAFIREAFEREELVVLETAKLLPVMHAYMPLALASSGSRDGIEALLDRLDWRRWFSAILTGEDVAHGKPAPEIFLEAAKQLGVAPDQCMVFEDTDAGITAGQQAGMTVFDVRATVRGMQSS